ncbi:hypothetical protein PV326_001780, partial [Microctonus aethiopoides]
MILIILAISLLASGALSDSSFHRITTRNMYTSSRYHSQGYVLYPCKTPNDPYGEWVYANDRAYYAHVYNCYRYSSDNCISLTRHTDFEYGPALYFEPTENCWHQNCQRICYNRGCFWSIVIDSDAQPTTTTPEPTTTSKPIDNDNEAIKIIDEFFSSNPATIKVELASRLSNLEVSTTPSPQLVYVPKCRDQYRCDPSIINQIIYGRVPSSSSASSSASASGFSASASASASSSSSASSPYISYPGFSYQYQPCQTQS